MMSSQGFARAFVAFIYVVLAVRAERDSGFEISALPLAPVTSVSAAELPVEEEAEDDEVTASTVLLLQLKSDLSQLPNQPKPPLLAVWPPGPYAEEMVKRRAMHEANMTCSDLSYYGAAAPKVPPTTVDAVIAMKRESGGKTSMYNFQGSVYNYQSQMDYDRRLWVLPFAESKFTDADVLVITDAPTNHTPLGPYDLSNDRDAFRPKDHPTGQRDIPFDPMYYQTMIQSHFTLCPGGDSAWSMRFYEAILAGSIPVIDSEAHALNHDDIAFWFDRVGYTYFTIDQMENMTMTSAELESIVDNNYKLVLKYQTWNQGDNVPPAYDDYKMPCNQDSLCYVGCNTDENLILALNKAHQMKDKMGLFK